MQNLQEMSEDTPLETTSRESPGLILLASLDPNKIDNTATKIKTHCCYDGVVKWYY